MINLTIEQNVASVDNFVPLTYTLTSISWTT